MKRDEAWKRVDFFGLGESALSSVVRGQDDRRCHFVQLRFPRIGSLQRGLRLSNAPADGTGLKAPFQHGSYLAAT